jgi:hypothetical protein
MVGAKGFEPSTSWSRTSRPENLKPGWCRAYDPNSFQNLPSVGTHGTPRTQNERNEPTTPACDRSAPRALTAQSSHQRLIAVGSSRVAQ